MRSNQAEIAVKKWLKSPDFDFETLVAVPKVSVYENYRSWCENNRIFAYTMVPFSTALRKLVPDMGSTHPRMNGARVRCFIFPATDEFDGLL